MGKKRHGHHGGAWKVAYADFVTAMMALFLVLWLTSQDEKIKEAVERSFRNPFMSVTKESTGLIPNKDTQAVKSQNGNFDSASAVELNMLRKLSEDILKTLQNSNPEGIPEETPVHVENTPDGMRLSIFDRAKRPIFQENSAKFTEYGSWVFTTLAWQVSRYTNTFRVELEGHTEKTDRVSSETYSEWELSSDRANAARRKLLDQGVDPAQIRRVAGYADTMPMDGADPTNQVNRRVTVMLKIPELR